ncbi:MAG: hypothetical protein ACI39R_07100 [Lachnospiraceae bacterium]
MVQIDFLDGNVINNLVPVFTMQPNILCILYDEKRFVKNKLEGMINAIYRKDSFITIKEYTCDCTDMEAISVTINQIVDEYDDEDIYADITGGPELMTACACMIGKEGRLCPIYYDSDNDVVFGVYDKTIKYRAKQITMDDYVTARGAKHFSDSRSKPGKEEYEMVCNMAEAIFDHIEEWKLLQKYLSSYFYGYSGMHFSVKNMKCGKERLREIESLLEYFVKYGFIIRRDDDRYIIKNAKYKEYITTYGIWLEMYVYIKALQCYDEAHLGYIIDWNGRDGVDTDDNEFDVIIMNKNHPLFISCKMTKPTSKDLTEIGYLSKRLGGRDAISIIATTYPVSSNTGASTSLYYRMKKLNIGLLEAGMFRKMSPAQAFETAVEFCDSDV